MEEESEDSLDLLLDTLCNAFGGIILITLLIALMSQEANEAPELPESFQAEWMLEQQEVSRIENELIIEQAIQENLLKYVKDKPVQVNTSLLKQKKDLEQKKIVEIANIKRLREELESLPVNSTNLALDLENKLKRLRESKFDTANLKDDQEMKIESLQSKLTDVQKEISATKSERTLALRLPKEKKRSGKTYEWVVIKHGLIYPLNYPDRSKILTEIEDSPTDTIYIPKPGKGLNLAQAQRQFLNYLETVNPKITYLAFMVFDNDECFKSFNLAKQTVASKGIGYSWEPLMVDLRLTTSGKGRGAGNEL
jgi:hypothetical protein